jgi:DNA replication protein
MTEYDSLQQMMIDQLSIPTKLLTMYPTLGLNETDLMVIIHIHRFLKVGIDFPTPAEIAAHMTITENEVMNHLRKLLQKDVLEMKELQTDQQLSEAYSLEPLWQKVFQKTDETKEKKEGEIFILFEQEFGRPLSPFEIETINVWLDEDQMKSALIKAALREAVLMGKLNFKYIDRILREWHRKGIRSVEQAREESKSFHQGQVKKQYQVEKRDTSVYFNWLKGEE